MAGSAVKDAETAMKALIDDDCLPAAARQMLLEGLPHAVKVPGDKRHSFQEQFVLVFREALLEISKAAKVSRAASEAAVEASKAKVEEALTAHREAISGYEAAESVVTERIREHAACSAAANLTRFEHERVLRIQTKADERHGELHTLKAEVSSILEGNLRTVLDVGSEDESVLDSTVDAVQQYLRKLGAEPALVAAAMGALRCKPESRQAFDKLTASSLEEVLRAEASRIDVLLMQHQPEQEQVSAEQVGLWALLDRESQREQAASLALADAELSKKLAAAARDGTLADISVKEAEVSQRLCEQVLAEERVKELGHALEAVERLVAFSYEAEAKADAAGPADVPMAHAAGPAEVPRADTAGSADVQMADADA